ncbi:MAG: hypothetical protein R6V13_08665 [Anaerolineae bacterium]
MPRYSVKTNLSPEESVEEAKAFFGEGGLGLKESEQGPCCMAFEGGGGHVTVTAFAEDEETTVEVETREWDYHVKRFMGKIG